MKLPELSLSQQITLVFLLIFLFIIALCSFFTSKKEQCYAAEEFDSEFVSIESNPVADGVTGYYPNQLAQWHDTGLRSNGDPFVIQVSGAWTAWNGDQMTNDRLNALDDCNFCAKKENGSSPNCICLAGKSPAPEPDKTCNTSTDLDNANLCTCTNQRGAAADYGVYFFPLNYFEKDQTVRTADNQYNCKYDRGIGAYIGLFGSDGVTIPKRLYHLYSTEKVCNILVNSDGECKDSDGVDQTRYVFRSANNRIFMKDDLGENDGTDTNTSDDVYHRVNEIVKFKIVDDYYSDNYGQYDFNILRGVGDGSNSSQTGLLEFMARLVETTLLGESSQVVRYDDGTSETIRNGGIIEFMYRAIVQDSGLILLIQVTLSLYIAFYGLAVLLGVAEITKKELSIKILRIGLVLLFTSNNSWRLYNQIVVGFFYDSMNYVVSALMDLSDQSLNAQDSTLIINAQMDRATDSSNSTRFSYIDSTITMLMSEGAAAKISGLFMGAPFFGFFYIPIIYLLIAFFIYVMLTAGLVYCINIIKIIFVLCLGPIFMCFMLFNYTNHLFKNWISFLGARSLEIIFMFFILYNFVVIINNHFVDLLYFRTCIKSYNVGLFSIKILSSEVGNRSFIAWMTSFFTIFGLTFMTKLILEKIPDLSGALIKIGGVENRAGSPPTGYGASGSAMASGIMTAARRMAQRAGYLGLQLTSVASTKALDSIPIEGGPREIMRNRTIDSAIDKAKKTAASEGLIGSAADARTRQLASASLQKSIGSSGIDYQTISGRLDKKLIQDPLKQFIKDESKRLKNLDPDKVPLGKDMRAMLLEEAKNWANTNLSTGKDDVEKYLKNIGNDNFSPNKASRFENDLSKLIDNKGKLTASEAAKRFTYNPEMQNKYLQDLQNREFERNKKNEDARKYALTWLPNIAGRAVDALNPFTHHDRNFKDAEASFIRQTSNQEARQTDKTFLYRKSLGRIFNPASRSNALNKLNPFGNLRTNSETARKEAMRSYLSQNKVGDNKKEVEKREFLQKELYKASISRWSNEFGKEIRDITKRELTGQLEEARGLKFDLLERTKKELLENNGETIFEKTARLSYLNKALGLEKEDPQLAIAKLINQKIKEELEGAKTPAELKEKLDNIKSLKSAFFSSDVESADFKPIAEEYLKKSRVRGADDLSERGLISLDPSSKTLKEQASTLKEEQDKMDQTILSAISTAMERGDAQRCLEIENKINAIEASGKTTEEKIIAIEAVKEELKTTGPGLIVKNFEVQFGSSISAVLLTEFDIGLKASNVLLGVKDEDSKNAADNYKEKASLEINKNQYSTKLKVAKMNQKVAEFELEQLMKLPITPENEKRITELKNDIRDFESDVRSYEREVSQIETKVISLTSSSS